MTMERFQPYKSRWKEIVLTILLILNVLVWVSVWGGQREKSLRVYFLDVGQGDAILVESPAGNRLLIDSGRNRQVISELGRAMPFGEKDIEVVIATHPDADHIGGMPEVFDRFDVSLHVSPGIKEDGELENLVTKKVAAEKSQTLTASRGQVVDLGGGAKLTILFPDRDVSDWVSNDASIVARLDYGESSFLFTGDAGIKTENILISRPQEIDADVLKVGHHGSRTSTSLSFAEAVSPEYSVISAGKDNSYGHPHSEVLKILESAGGEIVETSEHGMILFESDGKEINLKREAEAGSCFSRRSNTSPYVLRFSFSAIFITISSALAL